MIERQGPGAREGASPFARWWALAILSLLYVLSFVDRLILAMVVAPLKADLGISDVQIGLLFGTAFAVSYALASLPLARVADLRNRKRLIAFAVLFWSACTIASGFATSFEVLALLRFGLAVGEAALVPATLSLLADMFPPHRRVLAMTLHSTAGMIGAASAYVIGGFVINLASSLVADGHFAQFRVWQLGFMLVGAPGIVLAFILALTVKEPARTGKGADKTNRIHDVWQHVRDEGRLYPCLFLGAGFSIIVPTAMVAWGPAYLTQAHGLALDQAAFAFGMAQFIAGVCGTLLVPLVIQQVARRGRPALAAAIPAVLAVIGAALVAIGALSGSVMTFLACHAIGGLLLIGTTNAIILLIQPFPPARMRAVITATAMMLATNAALGIGPPLAALFARSAPATVNQIGWGLFSIAALGLVGAALLLTLAAPRFARTLGVHRHADLPGRNSATVDDPKDAAPSEGRRGLPG